MDSLWWMVAAWAAAGLVAVWWAVVLVVEAVRKKEGER